MRVSSSSAGTVAIGPPLKSRSPNRRLERISAGGCSDVFGCDHRRRQGIPCAFPLLGAAISSAAGAGRGRSSTGVSSYGGQKMPPFLGLRGTGVGRVTAPVSRSVPGWSKPPFVPVASAASQRSPGSRRCFCTSDPVRSWNRHLLIGVELECRRCASANDQQTIHTIYPQTHKVLCSGWKLASRDIFRHELEIVCRRCMWLGQDFVFTEQQCRRAAPATQLGYRSER